MNVQVAVLCDAATDSGGKLNLLGAFDTIYAPQLPVLHPHCSIALRMTFNSVEEGAHMLRVNFVDEDGRFVLPGIDLPLQVAVPADTHFVTQNCIVDIQPLRFERAGHYSIDIAVDGRQEASIPLMVKTAPSKVSAPG